MSLEPKIPSKPSGTPLAIAILACATVLFFASQINGASQQSKQMTWQMKNGDSQIDNAKKNEVEYQKVITQQAPVVEQVMKLQKEYQDMFEELYKLIDDGDQDAKAVVTKFGIQRPKPADKPDDKPAAAR